MHKKSSEMLQREILNRNLSFLWMAIYVFIYQKRVFLWKAKKLLKNFLERYLEQKAGEQRVTKTL